MVDWIRIDGSPIPSGQATEPGALGLGTGIGTITNVSSGSQFNIITFTSVSGASSYNIYWDVSPGVTNLTGNKISDIVSPYTHSGLTNGITYYYVYTAIIDAAESEESNEVSGTPDTAPPNPTYLFWGVQG